MYRSPGTSSSPDLATLLRRTKERASPMGSGKKEKEKERELRDLREREKERRRAEAPPIPGYDQQTLRQPSGAYSIASSSSSAFGERGRDDAAGSDWVFANPGRRKEAGGTGKMQAPKSSVRAKTSALWGKMMGQPTTVRERSSNRQKTDASLHPTPQALANAFTPPVPTIPQEHKSPVQSSPIADVFTSKRPLPARKPLPPIMSPEPKLSDDTDRSLVFVEKQDSPLPPLPHSPPAPITPKRRSNSYSEARPLLPMPLPLPTASSALASPPQTPDRRRESGFGGILDVFKGELSMLDPISLDLRDPSTPPPDGLALSLSPRDDDRPASTSASPTTQSPPEAATHEEPSHNNSVSAIVPPRTSSLFAPRASLTGHASGTRSPQTQPQAQLPGHGPLRSRSGPTTLAAQSQVYRDGARLRVLHRSTASSSEPSLISAVDDARARVHASSSSSTTLDLAPSTGDFDSLLARAAAGSAGSTIALRRGSEPYTSPDSANFVTSSTPLITNDELPDDMEARGKSWLRGAGMRMRISWPRKRLRSGWVDSALFSFIIIAFNCLKKIGTPCSGPVNKVALRYYVEYFDFSGLRLDMAFRRLCGKLYLKGETQQVDRILEQFSRRYWDCNPGLLYGSANLVHAVSYSLLLLNTDLHVAELSARMSRSQFVRNTMAAIQMQLQPHTDIYSARLSSSDLTYDDCSSSVRGGGSDETEMMTRSKRSNSVASWNSVSRDAVMSLPVSPASGQTSHLGAQMSNGSTQSVHSPPPEQTTPGRQTHGRAWEVEMENLLKEMYTAIKHQQILQPLNSSFTRSSVSSLSPGGNGMTRNRSLRAQPDRLTTLKRGSIRGLQSILSVQSGVSPYSSNSSIDGRVSPSPSFATSTHDTMYGSSSSFLNPALGFASNLSHTIIREAQEDDDQSVHSADSDSTTISISDEELALLGAPWAKEGMLCRKQYWESAGKRAKDKGWLDVFVVIQKGELNMFIFGDHTSGMSGTFGGGNWLANARPVGTINLAHSLAHALPPPGYHKRPHCMVLTLANRAVYFFQAGTEELVNEWVSTCNYWAARTSKEPLAGGVSNMEYGWNRVVDMYGNGPSTSQTDLQREPEYADTLDALKKHVASLKHDLEVHNELREPMATLYIPRSANAMKAQGNWEQKSQYLLREIVKYDLYIDSLQAAISLRLKKRGEKALEHALSHATPVEDPLAGGKRWAGPEEEAISEEIEPTTPSARQFPQNTIRRATIRANDDADD
ncbi:hypothetical protein BJ912DRAFT_1019831 [Pholiota molesta]|nr:hypothetical protein BJ912DRAFT_1019831 [Pholiota molesta]